MIKVMLALDKNRRHKELRVDDNDRLKVTSTEGLVETTDFETVTVSSTAIGLTEATIGSNVKAFITIEDNDIRVRVDGTDPTSSVGHYFYDGEAIELESAEELANFSAIAVAGDATLSVSYKAVV